MQLRMLAVLAALWPSASQPDTCAWTPPVAIAGVPVGTSVRWPTLAVIGTTVTLAANLFPTGAGPIGAAPLFIWSSRDGVLGKPRGDFLFAYPMGVHVGGAYHLFWLEPSTPVPVATLLPQQWPMTMGAVWHSEYRGGWSKPAVVLRGARLRWGADQQSVILDGTGTVHVFANAGLPNGASALLDVHAGRTDTVAHWAAEGTVVRGERPASLIAAFTGIDRTAQHSHDDLFTTRSEDGGRTWAAPARVSVAAPANNRLPRLANARGRTSLAWVEDDSSRVVFALSEDGARSWRVTARRPIPPGLLTMTYAGTEAVGEFVSTTSITVRSLTDSTALFASFENTLGPSLATTVRGTVLVWSGTRGDGTGVRVFRSQRTHCGCKPRC